MEFALITAQQIVVLDLLILAGAVSVKFGAIRPISKNHFSDLLLYVVVPAMIIHSYMTDFDPAVLPGLLQAFGLGFLLMGAGVLVSFLLLRRKKHAPRDKDLPIIRFACIFTNSAYMGFPLIQALYGSEGLLYASAFVTVFNILLWTLGYAMVGERLKPAAMLREVFLSPMFLSMVLGLLLYFFRVKVPYIIAQPLALTGAMNTPLAMLITGIIMAECSFRDLLTDRRQLKVVLIRMFVIPVFCFLLLKILGVSGKAAEVVFLLMACPSAAVTSVFAVKFHHDEALAAGSVVLTTLLSIITMPLFALALSYL